MQMPHLQILGKTEDWSYIRKISHKSCDSVIVWSRVTAPKCKYNVCKHVVAKVVITEQRDNSSHVQMTVNKMRLLLKKKNSRYVIYSVKITAFHCNFDLYFMYTKHLIDMHEVSFPLADITYIF